MLHLYPPILCCFTAVRFALLSRSCILTLYKFPGISYPARSLNQLAMVQVCVMSGMEHKKQVERAQMK